MLLRFSVSNHKSLRDEVELSLVSSRLKTLLPEGNDWRSATSRVAAVYGANASGKSNLLDAISYMSTAVRNSATRWAERPLPYMPFRLDDVHQSAPSNYAMDLIVDGVRYEYGFSIFKGSITSEWLNSYPRGRRRTLFERAPSADREFSFSRELPGDNVTAAKTTGPSSLFLSCAANVKHEFLGRIQHRISRHIPYARHEDNDKNVRLRMVKESLSGDKRAIRQVAALLRLADVGIERLELSEQEPDERLLKVAHAVFASITEGNSGNRESQEKAFSEVVEDITRVFSFHHTSSAGPPSLFSESDESSGTLAWLSLAVPALSAFRYADTLLIDELNASLHPRLSAVLVDMFHDPQINPLGAQLVFTTHESTFLSPMQKKPLSTDEVWFTEKNSEGATELFSLDDFSTRTSENHSRGYLQGRYGAVPIIDTEELRKLFNEENGGGTKKSVKRPQAKPSTSKEGTSTRTRCDRGQGY